MTKRQALAVLHTNQECDPNECRYCYAVAEVHLRAERVAAVTLDQELAAIEKDEQAVLARRKVLAGMRLAGI